MAVDTELLVFTTHSLPELGVLQFFRHDVYAAIIDFESCFTTVPLFPLAATIFDTLCILFVNDFKIKTRRFLPRERAGSML